MRHPLIVTLTSTAAIVYTVAVGAAFVLGSDTKAQAQVIPQQVSQQVKQQTQAGQPTTNDEQLNTALQNLFASVGDASGASKLSNDENMKAMEAAQKASSVLGAWLLEKRAQYADVVKQLDEAKKKPAAAPVNTPQIVQLNQKVSQLTQELNVARASCNQQQQQHINPNVPHNLGAPIPIPNAPNVGGQSRPAQPQPQAEPHAIR